MRPDQDPADLAAVQADDKLLDDVGSGGWSSSLDPLSRELSLWRRQVLAQRCTELVGLDMAVAVIKASVEGRKRSRRTPYRAGVAAAAVLMITLAVLGLVARLAGPGDDLCPVARVLYGAPSVCE